jgi:hypothetical protein
MTARESILEYLVALLAGVQDVTVFRSREAALDKSEGIAILVKPEEEPVEMRSRSGTGLVFRNLTVVITVIARGVVPDQLADPAVQSVHSLIMADQTLQGRCALLMEQSTKWDFEVGDGTAVAVEMRYTVRYQTSAKDISVSV